LGAVYLDILIKRLPQDPSGELLECLIDTGAVYSLAPADALARLGIAPHRQVTLTLADGSKRIRDVGNAHFEYQGVGGGAPVLFGQPGDINLLGVTALEAMGLMVDPLSRRLSPLPATLTRVTIP